MRLRLAALGRGALPRAAGGRLRGPGGSSDGPKTIVVTYSVLGAVVKDLVGDAATVKVLMPNGADPHEWEPSAKDIETLTKADLLVENGLGLEGGMGNAFAQAEAAGVKRFVASDHVTIRRVGSGEGADPVDPDQAPGAEDPHLWMDPLTVRDAMDALAGQLKTDLGIDVAARAPTLDARLAASNDEVAAIVATIPTAHRTLVTGHESLGYFAQRYGLDPDRRHHPQPHHLGRAVRGRPRGPGRQDPGRGRARDLHRAGDVAGGGRGGRRARPGRRSWSSTTHALPADGSYGTFLENLATLIADNLR